MTSASAPLRELVAMPARGLGRVDEAPPRFPSHTLLMLLLGFFYVALDLAFSAHLLDATATRLSEAQIQTIVLWSQALFGCALTLALWGTLVLPRLGRSQLPWYARVLALVLAGIVAMVVSVGAHQLFIARLSADATGVQGRKAVQLNLMTQALLDARMPVRDVRLPPELAVMPAGKAFLAVLLAAELGGATSGLPTADTLREAMQALVAQRLGTAAQVYDNIFVPSVRSLKDAFNEYVAAQTALVEDIRAITDKQAQAWNEYQDGLTRRGLVVSRIPRAEWPGMANDARQAGIAVPPDWNPGDRAAFIAAHSAQLRKQADAQYGERLTKLFGAELPPGLEWNQFFTHPIVQARWRTAIGAPETAQLAPTMGFQAFDETVYQPMVERIIEPKLRAVLAPPENFARGGEMEKSGQAAARWIAVPVVALGLSLLGAAWHLCGSVAYAGRVVAPRWRARGRTVALALVVAGVFILGARGTVTRSDAFSRFEDRLADQAGPIWLAALWTVEAQGQAHAWGDAIRRLVLGSYNFGVTAPADDAENFFSVGN